MYLYMVVCGHVVMYGFSQCILTQWGKEKRECACKPRALVERVTNCPPSSIASDTCGKERRSRRNHINVHLEAAITTYGRRALLFCTGRGECSGSGDDDDDDEEEDDGGDSDGDNQKQKAATVEESAMTTCGDVTQQRR